MTRAMFQTFDAPAAAAPTADRIAALRTLMRKVGLDGILVPRADEHQGEYVPASADRLRWSTGFTGSAGLAFIGLDKAVLFTDGRYAVQARSELDTALFEISMLPRPRICEWLRPALAAGGVIGFDPRLHTIAEFERLQSELKPHGIRLRATPRNLIDRLWGAARPPAPTGPVRIHPIAFAGQAADAKLAAVQKVLADARHDAVMLTLTDSIAWLFNIRGSDVPHNPVVLAFAIVPRSGKAELFIDAAKLDKEIKAQISAITKIGKPDSLGPRLKELRAAGKKVRVDPATASYWFLQQLGKAAVARGGDPVIPLKAIKNAAEIDGARAAHVRDGVAVCRFLAWLESTCETTPPDEISAVRKLEDFRRDTGHLKEISFPSISGSGAHGAIVHYRVTEATNRQLQRGELFLIDSGAQYDDGTTDITRTIAIGEPTSEMRRRFTQVLQGHIGVATARFPAGTRGLDLDPLARRALWTDGCDYDHGTGHGIGSYLCVHEGPQSISRAGQTVLQPGMLISNEPGYYKEGAFGIRIENVVLVTPAETPKGGDRPVMAFETLTLAPMDRRLIDAALLCPSERAWLDGYHRRVWREISPSLDGATKRWLKAATAPISPE